MERSTALYIRRSDDDQSAYSPEAQERQMRLYCELHGLAAIQLFIDDDYSGRSGDRPAFERLLADARLGRLGTIVVHKLDRLARNAELALHTINELERLGVTFISVSENIDFSTPMGRMVLTTLAGVAEYYSRNLGTETRKGLKEKAQRGGWIGPVPLGYERDGATLRFSSDQSAVLLAGQLYSTGNYSYSTIADELNTRGYRALDWQTGQRRLFGRESIRTILENRAYLGYVQCSGQEYPGAHPPIWTPEIWVEIQRIKGQRAEKGGKALAPTRGAHIGPLLAGLARCAVCGGPMWAHTTGRRGQYHRYYICAGRSRRTCRASLVQAPAVEDAAIDELRAFTIPPALHPAILAACEQLLQERDQAAGVVRVTPEMLQRQLQRLGLVWAAGELPDDIYERERGKLRAQLALAHQQPAARLAPSELGRALERMATLADVAQAAQLLGRRGILRQVFDGLYLADHELKYTTPTPVHRTLVGVIERLRDAAGGQGGWLMGLNLTSCPPPRPFWTGPQ